MIAHSLGPHFGLSWSPLRPCSGLYSIYDVGGLVIKSGENRAGNMLGYDIQKVEESVAGTAASLYWPMYIWQTMVEQP